MALLPDSVTAPCHWPAGVPPPLPSPFPGPPSPPPLTRPAAGVRGLPRAAGLPGPPGARAHHGAQLPAPAGRVAPGRGFPRGLGGTGRAGCASGGSVAPRSAADRGVSSGDCACPSPLCTRVWEQPQGAAASQHRGDTGRAPHLDAFPCIWRLVLHWLPHLPSQCECRRFLPFPPGALAPVLRAWRTERCAQAWQGGVVAGGGDA